MQRKHIKTTHTTVEYNVPHQLQRQLVFSKATIAKYFLPRRGG